MRRSIRVGLRTSPPPWPSFLSLAVHPFLVKRKPSTVLASVDEVIHAVFSTNLREAMTTITFTVDVVWRTERSIWLVEP
jgi:hypothetical protein